MLAGDAFGYRLHQPVEKAADADQQQQPGADYLQRNGTPSNLAQLEQHPCVEYLSVNSGTAYVAAGCAGFGLIQLPLYHVAAQLQRGELTAVLQPYAPPLLPLYVLYPQQRQVPPRRPTLERRARPRLPPPDRLSSGD